MKTLFKPIHSLSRVLRDSPGVTLGSAIFSNTPDLFNTQLREEANNFMVSIPVPGIDKENLNVHIEGQLLIISMRAHVKLAKTSASKLKVLHSFVLPDEADINRVHAKCRNGLLNVHIEKIKRTKKPIIIKVRGNDNDIRNTTPLNSWWKRTKEKMDLRKFIPNVRMVKTTSN
ncbi:MAG TPA: Hsp20/alpha crystallin family protein [Cyclobacteriaceae bacterium]|jgi:HSP20 family protein|nr:Hsp20/alpha crystallin family protein [Cyclobacteriaceae bacterium]